MIFRTRTICALAMLAVCWQAAVAQSINWRAPSYALQAAGKIWVSDDENSHTRSALLTPDGEVVISGSVTDAYSNDNIQSGRLLTIKRSQHDGHLIWSQQAEVGLDYCVRGGVAVDGNGDIIVGGTCDSMPVIIKYRGSDGQQLWVTLPTDGCSSERVQSVAVDVANDIFVSGFCSSSGSESVAVRKLAGANGMLTWLRTVPGSSFAPFEAMQSVPPQMVLSDARVYVAADVPFEGYHAQIAVTQLRASDGHLNWTNLLTDTVQALVALPGGDVVVAGSSVSRLDAATANPLWSTPDLPEWWEVTAAIDSNGDVVLAGGTSAGKLDAASGHYAWRLSIGEMFIRDVALAPSGAVLVTGEYSNGPVANDTFNVAQIGPAGNLQWNLHDDENGVLPAGSKVLPASDGSVLAVSSSEYSLPLWLLRIVTPAADDLFANGFES